MTDPSLPTVSILIAAYNAESFLERAVASALNQTYRANEVILVDDCSTDGTIKLVKQFQQREKRIRLIELSENGGPAVARNAGINAAISDWIAVLDADDCLCKNYIQTIMQVAMMGADIVLSNFEYYSVQMQQTFPSGIPFTRGPRPITAYEYVEHAAPGRDEADWGLLKPLYNKQFLTSARLTYPSSVRHGEDFLFMINALLAGARTSISSAPLYLYTDSYSGFSRTKIDYAGMSDQIEDLLRTSAVARDGRLKRLLRKRANAVRIHDALRKISLLNKQGNKRGLFFAALKDFFIVRALFRMMFGKMFGRSRAHTGRGP